MIQQRDQYDKEKQDKINEEKETYSYEHHLDELLREIYTYYPKDGLDKFEQLSVYIKKKFSKLSTKYKPIKFNPVPFIELNQHDKLIMKEIDKKKPKKLPILNNLIEDVLDKAKVLEYAGVNFTKEEWYKLKLAMKKFVLKSDAQTLRFWGKIYGRDADYFVLFGRLKSYPIKKYSFEPHVEPHGFEGLNYYTFWVTNHILDEWYELPNVTAEQLRTSRLFKYILTGRLDARVDSLHVFPGKESHLLKCQILRIMHSSFIVPNGYMETAPIEDETLAEKLGVDLNDKVGRIKEDFQMPVSNAELLDADKWVHEFAHILDNGKVIEKEPENAIGRFRSISEDPRKDI